MSEKPSSRIAVISMVLAVTGASAALHLSGKVLDLKPGSEVITTPVTWPAFANLHPFVPREQAAGYLVMMTELEQMLCAITGYDAVSRRA